MIEHTTQYDTKEDAELHLYIFKNMEFCKFAYIDENNLLTTVCEVQATTGELQPGQKRVFI